MKIKVPSKNVRYSFTALALMAGLILAFAVLAGAVTYRIINAPKATSASKKENLDVAQAASAVDPKDTTSAQNDPDNAVSSDGATAPAQNTSSAHQNVIAQTAAVSPHQIVDNTCSQLESQLKNTLQHVNDTQYALYTQTKDSLIGRLLGSIFGDYDKEVDKAYAAYQSSVNALYESSLGKLQNSNCGTSQLKLNLQPR